MINNSQSEIQTESLIAIAPKIADLYNKLSQPIVSDDKIEEFKSLAPAEKNNWMAKNANVINLELVQQVNDVMADLIGMMDPILGDKKVQNVMISQQQQALQSAQKTNTQAPATNPVGSLE